MRRIEIGPLHQCRASVHSGPPKGHRGALISGQHFSCLHDAFALSSHSVPFAAAAKSLQSCPTLSDPIDGSPPGSPVPGILQARTLERVAISFSNAWKWKVKAKLLSRVQLLSDPHGLQPTRLLRPWDFSGKSTGVGCHCLLYVPFETDTIILIFWLKTMNELPEFLQLW